MTTNIDTFLTALTGLSLQHGIVIGGSAILFEERWRDESVAYSVDDDNYLSFGVEE